MVDDALQVDELILARTDAGQREALREAANLSTTERRLLLFVNSVTALADLLPRFPDADAARQAAHSLMGAGLIGDADAITRARQTFPMES